MRHSLLKLLCGLALFTPALALAQVSLSIGDLTVEAGESDRAVATLTTDGTAVALQFDLLYDPAVVSVGTVNGGAALTLNHAIASNPISAGRDRVVITSTPVTPLNAGPLADINFTINGSAAAGTTDLIWDAVIIGDGAANAITPAGLTNGQITITVTAAPPPPPPPAMPAAPVPASPFWALALLALLILGAAHHHQGRPRGPGSGWQHGRQRRSGPMALPSLALLLCLLPVAPTTWAQNPLPGDANNDGVIDGQDVVLIVEQILELGVIPGDGDCNEDDVINVLDTICSQQAFVPGDTTPIILGPGDRSIPAGVPFEMVLFAADPDENAALTWALLSGPAGLVVGADGVLTWTPTAGDVGDNPVSVDVTDETDRAASATFTITVFTAPAPPSGNGPPVLNAPGNQSLPVNTPLAAEASATDPDAGDVLTYSLVNAPAGMSINPTTGAISWTPQGSQAGAADVVVQVTDSAGNSDFGSFIVTANGLNGAPTANDDLYVARKGETLVIPALEGVILNDEDPNDDPLSATKLTDPGKGTLDTFGADGGFSYTPVDPPPITIGLEEKCRTESRVSAGTMAAADVDNDGVVELVNLVGGGRNLLFTNVFVVDGRDCTTESNATVPEFVGAAASTNASTLVNLDDDPELEVVGQYFRFNATEGNDERLYALNLDGTPLENWPAHGLSDPNSYSTALNSGHRLSGPVAADLDADGNPELITGLTNVSFNTTVQNTTRNLVVAYDGRTGAVLWEFLGDITRSIQRSATPTIVDLDLDGDTEIIWSQHVLDHEGNLLFNLPVEQTIPNGGSDFLTVAIANFDNDAFPEIIAYNATHLTLYSHDGQIQWQIERDNGGFGFPWSDITIAELDGDPFPEFVSMLEADGGGDLTLYAFDSDGQELWEQGSLDFVVQTFSQTRNSSPVAFDLDGDGIDELIQTKGQMNGANDPGLYIFDGRDGTVIAFQPINPQNNQDETVTVADVDGDGFAEIITNDNTEFGADSVQIWDNLLDNPFPPAPRFRSGTNYQTSWFGEDASLPTSLPPFWLEPGQNGWNMIQPPADPLNPERDSFTYRANDGALDSNGATVNIEIQPLGNPPSFISQPLRGISRGIAYVYEPLVVDIDPGDVLIFELVAGPVGMTINAQTGRLDWYPDSAGNFPVSIVVNDTMGFSSAQIFSVEVGDPVVVPDVVGDSEASAETTLTNANLTKGDVFVRSHPTIAAGLVIEQSPLAGSAADFGAAVALTVSSGAGIFDRDDDGDGFSENTGDCDDGDNSIFPGAADPNGDGIDQNCDGLDGNKTLVAIELTPSSRRVLANAPTPIVAMGIFDDGTAQNITSLATWVNGPTFISATSGNFVAEASFRGIVGTADFNVVDRVAEDLAPLARIDAPSGGEVVSAPVDVVGTANDANFLRWELHYRYGGEDEYVLFGEDTSGRSNQPIGSFDPSNLINGLYEIRLRAYDRGGNVSEAFTTVQVEGQLKIGNFRLEYIDLELPLNGIPITLMRTYDSRDKRVGDFGVGWRLGVNSIEVRTNRELGSAWRVFRQGLTFGLIEDDVHLAAVRLPGGRIEAFEMVVGPSVSPIVPFPPFSQSVSFAPLPGTRGTLESLEANNISILDAQPGPVSLRLDSDGSVYNPTLFRYTAPDGTQIDLDTEDGIQRIETTSGQVLTFTPTRISHSNGTVVNLQRDDAGRITQVTDPRGFTQTYGYDANGDLRSHRDQENFVTRFDYDANHNVIKITDPLDRVVVRHEYDDEGRVIRTTDGNGAVTEFEHDLGANEERVTDAGGFQTLYEYDDRGNVIRVEDALGGVRTRTFDSDDNLLTMTNEAGETTRFTYDARGNRLTITNPMGAVERFTYDANDRLTSERDALGRTTAYEFGANGRLVTVRDADGNAREITRDASGNLLVETDEAGRVMQFEYDGRGYQTAAVDARGNRVERGFNANGDIVSIADARGAVDAITVDGRGLVAEVVAPSGDAMSFGFNGVGELLAMENAHGESIAGAEDAVGNLLSVVDPNGNVTRHFYDSRNNRIRTVDQTGRETRYEYDALSRRTRIIFPDGGVQTTTYDPVGRISTETDPNGNVMRFEYDLAGRNTAVIDALGQRTEFTYDAVGNLISRLDARGNRTDYVFDALDQLIETRYPDGSTSAVDYDAVGNITTEMDRLGRTKSYTYDPNNNLLTVTETDGGLTSFAYDENNNRIAQTDANGHTTRMVYDANDRLIRKQYPDGSTESYEYDAGGRVARTVLPDGKFIDATYDGFGRPTGHDLNGEATESFTYDDAGRLLEATNLWGTVDYGYDADGRVTRIDSEGGHSVSYTYDALGNRTSIATQLAGEAPRTTTYSYDALNRLATVVEPDGDTTRYAYDPVGNVASITYPNGVVSTFTYDSVNQLTRIEHRRGATVLAAYDYTLDAGGRRLRVDHENGDSVAYRYDAADRLLQETHRDAGNVVVFEQTFSYDIVGNRLTQQIAGQAQTVLAYDSADKLLSAGAMRFAYDANGRLLSRTAPQGVVSYVYDVEGQLLEVTTSAGTVTYGYDANGKRRRRGADGGEQNYLLDEASLTGFDQTLVAFDENDTPLAEYHWGERLLSADDGTSDRFYHFDASSNTRLLTDPAGNTSDTYAYDAFGNVRGRTGVADNPYGFAGEWQQDAEGLVFLRARFYDPETGRFISRDPFGGNATDPVSLHRYLYANANPIMNTDPSGMLTLAEVKVSVAISVTISVTTDLIKGESPKTIVVNAVTSAIFGVIGAGLAGNVAKGFAGAAATATRKGLVYAGIITAKAAINTVTGVAQLASADFLQGNRQSSVSTGTVIKLFLINIIAEAFTFGVYKPSTAAVTKQVAKRNLAKASLNARMSGLGAAQAAAQRLFRNMRHGDDAVEILRRGTSGLWGKSRNALIPMAEQQLALLASQAQIIMRMELTEGASKMFSTPAAFDLFIEYAKKGMEKVWEVWRSNKS